MKPRAMLTRCCSPPENVAGGSDHSRSGRLSRASSAPAFCRAAAGVCAARQQRLGHHVEGGDTRHHAQELADIADGVAAHGEHGARTGRGQIDQPPLMGDDDLAAFDSDSCRRSSSGSSSCPRPTGRRARRIRRPSARSRRPTAPAERRPSRRCMVKLLATSETTSGVGIMLTTCRIEETRSWV